MWLTCLSGNETEAAPLIESTIAEGTAGGQGHAVSFAQCMAAILYNGLGRYTAAQAAAAQARHDPLYVSMWALPELIEAAVRSGDTRTARMRWNGWRKPPRPAARTTALASRHARARC